MIESVLVFGVIIFLGFALILIKLPRKAKLWCLSHPMLLDILVTVGVVYIHWGTMTGLMAAAVAGMCCAVCTSFGRWAAGYWKDGDGAYIPGAIWNLSKTE